MRYRLDRLSNEIGDRRLRDLKRKDVIDAAALLAQSFLPNSFLNLVEVRAFEF